MRAKLAQVTRIYNIANSKKLEDEFVELEFKLGEVNKGVEDGESTGAKFLHWDNAYKYAMRAADRKYASQYKTTIYNVSTKISYRKIEQKNKDTYWKQKKVLHREPNEDYWSNITISSEWFSGEYFGSDNEETLTRHISRHSFHIKNAVVDMSRVNTFVPRTSTKSTSYEIEVEYNPKVKGCTIEDFFSVVEDVIREMLATPLLFSYKELVSVSSDVNKKLHVGYEKTVTTFKQYVDRRYFSEARTMNMFHVTQANLFGPSNLGWHISLKTDGLRSFLVILMGTWTFYPPFRMALHAKNALHENREMTVLDGEMVDDTFFIIDALYVSGVDVRNKMFTERLASVEKHMSGFTEELLGGLQLKFKNYFFSGETDNYTNYVTEASSFFHVVKQTLARRRPTYRIACLVKSGVCYTSDNDDVRQIAKIRDVKYGDVMDGVSGEVVVLFEVFTERLNAVKITDASPNTTAEFEIIWNDAKDGFLDDGLIFTPTAKSYNDLTETKLIYKWKPKITVDLVVQKKGQTLEVYALNVQDGKQAELVNLSGHLHPRLEGISLGSVPYYSGSVVEFEIEDARLIGKISRPEKSKPNTLAIVKENWESSLMKNQILDERTITGETSKLMRKYHNRIKQDMISKCTGGILLDIGGGTGSDVNKWINSKFTTVIVIEPSKKNVADFKERIASLSKKLGNKEIFIYEGYGEDYEFIGEKIATHTHGYVDAISMMDSLTFFFDKEGEKLSALKKVFEFLRPQGTFIWKALDGNKVKSNIKASNATIRFGDSSITVSRELTAENKIKVDITDFVSNQEEYLVDLDKMSKTLDVNGEIMYANEEKLLSESYQHLSRMYAYGIFTKGSTVRLPPILTSILGSIIAPTDLTCVVSRDSPIEALFALLDLNMEDVYETIAKKLLAQSNLMDPPENQPPYSNFEIVYDSYFAKAYLDRLSKEPMSESDVVYNSLRNLDEDVSLAVADLLGIDMYVAGKTNAMKFRPRVSVVVTKTVSDKYEVNLYGGSILLESNSKHIPKTEKLLAPKVNDIYRFSLTEIPTNIPVKRETNVLKRFAFLASEDSDVSVKLALYEISILMKGEYTSDWAHLYGLHKAVSEETLEQYDQVMKLITKD